MADNRPRGRKRNVTEGGSGFHMREEGLGTGPVGGRGDQIGGGSGRRGGSGGGNRNGRGMGGLPMIVVLIILLLGGGGSLGGLFGGGGSSSDYSPTGNNWNAEEDYTASTGDENFNHTNSHYGGNGSLSTGWNGEDASHTDLDSNVASGSREKYTKIKGNGKDTVTIMVYLCGTDLESRSGMGTADLQEMASAKFGSNINLLVFTGGCSNWRNSIVSNKVNQIYQVMNGGVKCLEKNAGTSPMTSPDNLAGYIQYCAKNFPADRYELILWDHGGGSVSGYGYDEKYKSSGSMTLSGIRQALEKGGVKFDFIGFDACLMATTETALMLGDYGDYMVASEETEPGVGWYYTDWLTALGKNTSMPTTEIGQQIVDSFIEVTAKKCPGQKMTLSVIDLAELQNTVPDKLSKFSKSVSSMISDKKYQQVSQARNHTREFAASTRIDQVDMVHLAENMGTKEGKDLAKAIRSAVKYNRTSVNMANAYGLSIYFPYRSSAKYVDSMSKTYQEIGMDSDYMACIRQFASLQVSGQAGSGGTGSPYDSLFGDYAGQFSGLDSGGTEDLIGALLTTFLGGDYSSVSGMSSSGSSFLSDRALSEEDTMQYIKDTHFDVTQLGWVKEDGKEKIKLSQDQWEMVTDLELNTFVDTGKGYADLGKDNVYEFDEEGNLIADEGKYWISINKQPVPYYHTDTLDDGTNYTIAGIVPCLINGELSNLVIVFDNAHESGYVAGIAADYGKEEEIDVVGKTMTELEKGDVIEFVCNFYNYDGSFEDTHIMGTPIEIKESAEELAVSDTEITAGNADLSTIVTYTFKDLYGAEHWTEALKR